MKPNKHNKVEKPVDKKIRKKFTTAQKIGAVAILVIILLCLRAFTPLGLGNKNASQHNNNPNNNEITCAQDLEGKRAGSLVGSACLDDATKLVGPNGQALGFNTTADVFQALEGNKVDATVLDGPLSIYTSNIMGNTQVLDDIVSKIEYGAIFSKTSPQSQQLKTEFNTFLQDFKNQGKLQAMWDKWLSADDSLHTIDYSQITGEKGTIEIPTSSSTGAPCVYVHNNELVGLDIDLAVAFCSYAGYKPEFKDMSFDSIIMSISTNKYPMAMSSFTITPERAQSVDFSDPYYDGGCLITVKSSDKNDGGFLASFASGFKRTFIDENRWQMFLSGCSTTFIISFLALILGTLLGLIVFLICHKGGKIANKLTDGCIWLLKGMPVVVLLMILFYIVFGKSSVNGTFVSIVAFTLLFGAVTIGLLRTGLDAIDDGQREAGLALGYSDSQTFIKIILPQAIRHMLPSYESEAVELLKGTAIVGYIAVQDLTKIGDMIRSSTYDAIFPLLAVAFLYFVLEAIIKGIIKIVDKVFYQRTRKNDAILKGINSVDVDSQQGQKIIDSLLQETKNDVYKFVANDDVFKNASEQKIVKFEHVKKSYDGKNFVLKDVNCDIYKGDVITLIGGSGCGKSTLIRCLNFLDPATEGSIVIDGVEVTQPGYDVTQIRKKVGTIFQRWNLFDHWTVVENVMNPLIDLQGETKQKAYDMAVKVLTLLGLGTKVMSYPSELSGGQQQRVAIARTLVMKNDVVVLDEPTSALDPCTVTEIAICLRYFAMHGKTLIIVTHDMEFARSVCNRIFFICDGKIYEQGTPAQILDNPQKEETKIFINQVLAQDLNIRKNDADLLGATSQISDFCMRHRIPKQKEKAIQKVLAYCIRNIFIPYAKTDIKLKSKICFAQKTKQIYLVFEYSGNKKNLLEEVEANVKDYIDEIANKINYNTNSDDGFANKITITL